jgi:hypothetical protein
MCQKKVKYKTYIFKYIFINIFFVDRRNNKPMKTHTHKVEGRRFEPRSRRLTLVILTFCQLS